jgi:hypothetical protein
MIIEVRTYDLKPTTLATVEQRFGEALPLREKHSKLAAFWHTEVGALNRIIHIWAYESLEHRTEVRAAATKEPGWPPPIREFVTNQNSEIFIPAPFSPALEPRQIGPVFEMRRYTLAPGALPGVIERWATKIDERTKLSPLVGAWHTEFGALNIWLHIWAYKDAAERQRIRGEAVARGLWPPGSGATGAIVKQENTIVMPSAFSPIR